MKKKQKPAKLKSQSFHPELETLDALEYQSTSFTF